MTSSSSADRARSAGWLTSTSARARRTRGIVLRVLIFLVVVAVGVVSSIAILNLAEARVAGSANGGGAGAPVPSGSSSPTPSATPDADYDPRTDAGVPADIFLKPVYHDLKITKPGTVVEGLDVHGKIIVKAENVTIRNVIVRGADTGSQDALIDATRHFPGLVIENVEVFATVESYWINGIIGSHFTVRNSNIHNVIDQVQITGDDVLIENNWFHGNLHYEVDPNQDGTPSHDDNIEMFGGKNIMIRNNILETAKQANLQLSQVIGPITDLTMDGNFLSSSWCHINMSVKKLGPMERINYVNNVFANDSAHPNCAIITPMRNQPTVLENNTWEDGSPIPAPLKGDH